MNNSIVSQSFSFKFSFNCLLEVDQLTYYKNNLEVIFSLGTSINVYEHEWRTSIWAFLWSNLEVLLLYFRRNLLPRPHLQWSSLRPKRLHQQWPRSATTSAWPTSTWSTRTQTTRTWPLTSSSSKTIDSASRLSTPRFVKMLFSCILRVKTFLSSQIILC